MSPRRRKMPALNLDPKQRRLTFTPSPSAANMNVLGLGDDHILSEIVESQRRKIQATQNNNDRPKAAASVTTKLSHIVPHDHPVLLATIESLQAVHDKTSLGNFAPCPNITAHNSSQNGYPELKIRDGRHTFLISDRRQRVMRSERNFSTPEAPQTLKLKSGWMAVQGVFAGQLYVSNTLGRDIELRNGDYLRVEQVLYSEQRDNFLLCGLRFRKIQDASICQMLSATKQDTHQEVCQVLEARKVGDADEEPQQLFMIAPEQVQGHCRVVGTNAGWMERLGAFDDFNTWPTVFYRYRFLTVYSANGKVREGAFVHLTAAEADVKWRVDDNEKRTAWRGQKTIAGGSSFGMRQSGIDIIRRERRLNERAREKFPTSGSQREKYDIWSTEDSLHAPQVLEGTTSGESAAVPLIVDGPQMQDDNSALTETIISIDDSDSEDLTDASSSQIQLSQSPTLDTHWLSSLRTSHSDPIHHPTTIQRYTAGDGFCGGGGTARGMREASLSISFAFDIEPHMITTYAKNNPSTLVACTSVFDFVSNPLYHRTVDILHLSPPCQYFSPAHTVAGQSDEANSAAQFMITGMLAATRPRVVTLEQTEGIISRHPEWFMALVEQFTTQGFSVRWKVLNMADYGVPQERLRLIVLAACPGEALPDFPAPNHTRVPRDVVGKRPFHSVADAIRGIPVPWFHHNPMPLREEGAARASLRHFDGETELAKTLTCHGGIGNNHPSGQRGYTLREFAALQTFPAWHLFPEELGVTVLKRQVGNAVPPLFAKRLFEGVVEHLRRVDGVGGKE